MNRVLLVCLGLFALASCTSRLVDLEGVYDLVYYRGKPLPFEGVRGGKIALTLDGEFTVFTERAVVLGQAESVTDTTFGRFGFEGWRNRCTSILLRFDDQSLEPRVWAEVCDGELSIPDRGVVFRRRRQVKGKGGPPSEPPASDPLSP